MIRCWNQATKCKFRDVAEMKECLIEQPVVGTKHRKVQEMLLEKAKALSLDKAIGISQTHKAILLQFEWLGGDQKGIFIESKRAPAMVRSLGSALIVAWNILQEPGKVALCMNLSVLTARNETIGQELVAQTTAK